MVRRALWLAGASVVALASAAQGQDLPFMEYARVDPAKIMTAEACGECHAAAFEVWRDTPHATTFKTMHRKERAEAIAEKLGFGLIKRDSFCFSCHYTPVVASGKIRVVSGVSCESCHGAGAEWIEVHNDYGPGNTHATEPADHRRERIERSRDLGMRRPSDLYGVAANCFSCHSVPNERLVNVGGHSTGSAGFELVEWSQGEIRHNFLEAFKRGEVGPNAGRSQERKRTMYVAGRALDLEYSLRGAAVAASDGVYAKAMTRRVRSAVAEMKAIESSVSIPEVGPMLAAVKGVRVGPGNEAELLTVADEIGRQTRTFLERAGDGMDARLAALDPLLAGAEPAFELAETQVVDEPAAAVGEPSVEEQPASGPVAAAAAPGDVTVAPGGKAPQPSTPSPAPAVVGQFKRRVRPASRHATMGSNACSGCHESQNQWWFGHAHYRSADPFFAGESKNEQIARLYGIDPAEMTTGRQVCMDCHGTIVSGKESRDVLDGVSCESCHGAAAGWLEPHKDETNKELGANRPGYLAALELGKNELDDLQARAATCTGCHYITEPRLLSAGHPSGADFDYAAGMAEVKHWQESAPPAQLASAFASRLAARGAVPEVRVAQLQEAPGATSGAARPALSRPTPTSVAQARGQSVRERQRAAGLRPPAPRPVLRPSFDVALPAAGGGDLDLPPFPAIDESTPIEETLLRIQERLKVLYESVAPATGGER
jgi:hypothetical protein